MIVENNAAKRKTPTQISFSRIRLFQFFAKDAFIANPNVTFSYILPLLGKSYEEFSNLIKVFGQEEKGWIKIDSKSVGVRINNEVFKLEEILAMILRDAKVLAEKAADDNVTSCVITIPPSFDQYQRMALKSSLDLAGMTPLAFVNENLAASLKYSLDILYKRPSIVVYVNMGASEFKVSVVKHTQEISEETKKLADKVEVLGEAWDTTLGGRQFDYEVAKILENKFNKSMNSKAKRKLLASAEDIKEKLSAVKFIDVFIDKLANNKDLEDKVLRSEFEARLEKYEERIRRVIELALEDSNITEIDDIELLGGGLRVPFIKSVITKSFNDSTLNQRLNLDEAMSFGAGFLAARLSNTFKVKPISIVQSTNYEIYIKIHDLSKNTLLYPLTILFPRKSPYNIMKAVSFYYNNNISISLYERGKKFVVFEVQGITEQTEVSLLFEINEFGIIDLKSTSKGEIIKKYEYSMKDIKRAKTRIEEIEAHEKSLLDIAEARNNYESLIYDTKHWLNDDYNSQFITKEDKKKLMQLLRKVCLCLIKYRKRNGCMKMKRK